MVTRDDYFDAALTILSTAGYGGLKLAPVCELLKVTTGSFYNYFNSWGDFKAQFLQAWLDRRTMQLVEIAQSESEPTRRLEVLIELSVALPHHAEAAIRAWSHSDPDVKRIQATVDEHRFAVTYEAMLEILHDAQAAEDFTHLGTYILTGFQQVDPTRDTKHLQWSLERLLNTVLASAEE